MPHQDARHDLPLHLRGTNNRHSREVTLPEGVRQLPNRLDISAWFSFHVALLPDSYFRRAMCRRLCVARHTRHFPSSPV